MDARPPADARRVAIDAIVRIDEGGAYANVVVPRILAESGLDGRDRAFVTELVYGSTRRRRSLDHVIDRYLVQDPPPVARAALRIGAHQLLDLDTPAHAAVGATVAATPKRFRGLVNAVLRKVAAARDADADVVFPTTAIELSYPDWIVDRLTADLGAERARTALATMNGAATVHRRADGYVQDRSSQLVAASVPAGPATRVLDLCAAPGGKATAIAATGATVIAADIRLSRLGLVVDNAARLGLGDLHVVQADGTVPPFRAETFDTVLVDAPCSGLGALRRRPDARWRIEAAAVGRLADLQVDLLRAAAPLVAPGGALVYSVCTLTRAESVGVVERVGDDLAGLGFDLDAGAPEAPWVELAPGVGLLLPGPDHDGMCRSVWHRH